MLTGSSRRPAAAVAIVTALVLSGCWSQAPTEPVDVVEIATGPDAETALLAEVVAALVREAGISAEVVELADPDDARQALEVGDVDVLPSYTGEAWLRVLGRADPPSDPGTSLARVREHDERSGLRWLRPTVAQDRAVTAPPADATFALVVQVEAGGQAPPPAADVDDLSGLAGLLGQLDDPALCVDPAFAEREDGWRVVAEAYSIGDVRLVGATPEEAVLAVAGGACVAGLTSATDGAAWLAGQRPVRDDLEVFPAFVVVPVVRQDALVRHEGLEAALTPLLERLTTERLGRWNARVVAGDDPAAVATDAVAELTTPEE